jgi:hypothetical protein
MDSSQRTRLIMEAANQFVSRTKTVDSSFLTMKNQQRAAWADGAQYKTAPYFRGAPTVNPILYDISSCPIDHSYTQGYSSVNKLSQHDAITDSRAGAAICGDADYSTAPQFIYLQNASTCNTILTSYNNNVSFPSGPNGPPSSAGLTSAYWASLVASSSGNDDKTSNSLLNPSVYVFPGVLSALYFQSNTFIQASIDNIYPTIRTTNTSGADDFTIEFYVQPTIAGPSTQTIFYVGAPAVVDTYKLIGDLVVTKTSGLSNTAYAFQLTVSTLGTARFGEFLPDKWYHVTVMRHGSTMYYFQNGSYMGELNLGAGIPSSSGTTNYLSGTESTATIGGKYNSGSSALATGFNGYLTSFRWIKALAQYIITLDGITSVPKRFQVPGAPLFVNTLNYVYTSIQPYVAVGLLAESAETRLTNSRSPSATVSLTDGNTINAGYTAVSWARV